MELYYTSKTTAMNQYSVSTTESLGYGSGGWSSGGSVASNTAQMQWDGAYDASDSYYLEQESNQVYSHYQAQPYQMGVQRAARPRAPLAGGIQRQFARPSLNRGDEFSQSWSGAPGVVKQALGQAHGLRGQTYGMRGQTYSMHGQAHGMPGGQESESYAQNFPKKQVPMTNPNMYTSESAAGEYGMEMQGYAKPVTSPSKPVVFNQRTATGQPRIQSIAPRAAAAHRAQMRQIGAPQNYGLVPRGFTAAGRGAARASLVGPRLAGTASASTSRLNLIRGLSPPTPVSAAQPVTQVPRGTQLASPTSASSSSVKDAGAAKDESSATAESVSAKQSVKGKAEEEEEEDDEDDGIDMNGCKLCDIKFEKVQAYHVHIRSTSHHQKVEAHKKEKMKLKGIEPSPAASTLSTATTTSVTLTATTTSSAAVNSTKKEDHYCYVCNFPFSNAEVFNSHLQGLLHLRRLEEQNKAAKATTLEDEEYDEDSRDSSGFASYKKTDWMSASEKDLNPEDIGKPGSAQYSCDVCNVSCTGLKSFEMHIAGAKHLKKLKKAKELGF